jgi:prophage regulatory protein
LSEPVITFLPLAEVEARVGLKKTKIYEMVRDGEFPPPGKIGRLNRWRDDAIAAWQQVKIPA